jgi:hypothetical protein
MTLIKNLGHHRLTGISLEAPDRENENQYTLSGLVKEVV